MSFNDDILKRVNSEWLNFKTTTRMNQSAAAKAMGMNQSAFSQYLRGPEKGGIALNEKFLRKFSDLTGIDFVDELAIHALEQEDQPRAAMLEVKYALSGRSVSKRVPVYTFTCNPDTFLVEIDCQYGLYPAGHSYFLIEPNTDIRDGDMVVYVNKANEPLTVGQLKFLDDEWIIVSPYWGGKGAVSIDPNDNIHRVAGTYINSTDGRKTFKKA